MREEIEIAEWVEERVVGEMGVGTAVLILLRERNEKRSWVVPVSMIDLCILAANEYRREQISKLVMAWFYATIVVKFRQPLLPGRILHGPP